MTAQKPSRVNSTPLKAKRLDTILVPRCAQIESTNARQAEHMNNQDRFNALWKGAAGSDELPGIPPENPLLGVSSDDSRLGRALFNHKEITYLVTFLKSDPTKADFVPLDDLPWYGGVDRPDQDDLQ